MDADVHEKYAVCVHSDGQLRHSSLRTSRRSIWKQPQGKAKAEDDACDAPASSRVMASSSMQCLRAATSGLCLANAYIQREGVDEGRTQTRSLDGIRADGTGYTRRHLYLYVSGSSHPIGSCSRRRIATHRDQCSASSRTASGTLW